MKWKVAGCAFGREGVPALAIKPRAGGHGQAADRAIVDGQIGEHERFPSTGPALRQVSGEPAVPSRMRRSVRTRLLHERTSAGRPRTSLVMAWRPRRVRVGDGDYATTSTLRPAERLSPGVDGTPERCHVFLG